MAQPRSDLPRMQKQSPTRAPLMPNAAAAEPRAGEARAARASRR